MEMTDKKLKEIQHKVVEILREYDLDASDVVTFFAFMLGKSLRIVSFGNPVMARESFKRISPAILSMFDNSEAISEITKAIIEMEDKDETLDNKK